MESISKIIYKLDELLSILALTGIIGVVSANIFFRFFFNTSIAWTEEISLGLFVWLVFTGFSVVMKRNEHVSIDYFVRKFHEKIYKTNQYLIMCIIFSAISLIFIIWGSILTFQSTWNVTPVLGIGYEWIYLAVPVGGVLSVYHIMSKFLNPKHNANVK